MKRRESAQVINLTYPIDKAPSNRRPNIDFDQTNDQYKIGQWWGNNDFDGLGNIFNDSSYSKEDISREEVNNLNKSRRGFLLDQNKENIFIGNLIIHDNIKKEPLSEIKRHKELVEFDESDLLNIKIPIDSLNPTLDQIPENELENLESSTERFPDSKKMNDPTQLSKFLIDLSQKPLLPSASVSSSHHKSHVKESMRYS